MAADRRLMSELQQLQKEKWVHVNFDEAFIRKWTVGLMVVNPDSVFCGAYLRVCRYNPWYWS
jgi:ubiquitin-conjugating enzyme E2 R